MSATSSSDPAGGSARPGPVADVPPPGRPGGPDEPSRPAELQPLPYDGVASVAVGTVVWALAAVIMLFFLDDLRDDGHLWWLATAICGFVLGLAGLWIVVRRRNRLRARDAADAADSVG